MRAAVIDTPGQVRVTEVPDPTPGPGQVVVAVGACGVCGTDLHIAAGEFPPTPYPIIPGHEFAGEVVARGSGVGDLAEGDRVAVDPSLYCGSCRYCRRGRGNLCQRWGAIGDTVDGAFAQYVAVPAANCHRLPESLELRQGALVEPLSCAVHGLDRLGDVLGERALVVGAGTMGLLLAQLLARAGATTVAVVDKAPGRAALAAELGASATGSSVASVREAAVDGFDVAVDATGVPAAIDEALAALARGGRLLVFGVAPPDAAVAISPFRVYNDEITVLGSMAVLHSFGRALDLLARGAVRVDPLLGTPFPLDRFPEALAAVREGKGLKTQVAPDR